MACSVEEEEPGGGTSVKSLLVAELESNKRMWGQVEKLGNRPKKYCEVR